jgi:3-polyprenyl-4-hydroxybenzoate decarboxylase
MTNASRRAFLAATGTTAAAAVALGASPAAYASSTAPSSDGQDRADLVAYVHSGSSGLVTLLVGEREPRPDRPHRG